MATGIRDKVVVLGMGCTRFGERWDMDAEGLLVEAFLECIEDAGIEKNEIQAAWLGTFYPEISVGPSALPLSMSLRLPNIPVTRVENFCASGTEAFRGAVYAVASGAYDICLAAGVEKLKDTGYGGLPEFGANSGPRGFFTGPSASAPGCFALLASAYAAKYNVPDEDLKRGMAHVSAKSHANGVKNPKAHMRKAVTEEQVMAAPIVAHPLGLFDCCGVSDGSACAIVTTPEIAKGLGKKDLVSVKALQLALSNGYEMSFNEWDVDHLHLTAGRGHQGHHGRLLRQRREDPVPDRRRPEVLRPPDRRLGAAHALRDVPAAARSCRRETAGRPPVRAHAQPRRNAVHERRQRGDHWQIRKLTPGKCAATPTAPWDRRSRPSRVTT
jgi:acetyl-CoA C-acetyltransferase